MTIQLLHTVDCHAWKDALVILEQALKEAGQGVRFEVVLIETPQDAQKFKFLGSPTIMVNGIDVDPRARNVTSFAVAACRPYFYNGKSHDYPPKEMIIEALKETRS